MRPLTALLFLGLTIIAAGLLMAAGTAYIVRSPSAGLYERPNAAEPVHTLIKGQIVTVLQRRGEWLRIINEEGEDGWVREVTVAAISTGEEEESSISEASPDDIPEAVFYEFVVGRRKGNIRRDARIGAPIVRTAPAGEVLTIVSEEGQWYQVALKDKVEGWMHKSVGTKRESRNISLQLLDLIEGKLTSYDQFKAEASFFRRAGWFPSFFLRRAEKDLQVFEVASGGKEVTVHLSYARRDVEYRMVIESADAFSLPGATRTFFSDLLLSVIDTSTEIRRARIHLWLGVLESNGRMAWRSMGELELTAEAAGRVPRDSRFTAAVWSGLEKNTIPAELWQDLE